MSEEKVSLEDLRKEWKADIDNRLKSTTPTFQTHTQPAPQDLRHVEDALHNARWYETRCQNGNCNETNPNYRKPSHYCKNCRIPVNVDEPSCKNCGGTEAEEYK